MAKLINIEAPTLAEVANRTDRNGKVVVIVETLKQTNEILEDMRWVECNETMGYKHVERTGLPKATWRMLNRGVDYGKSTTTTVTDTCASLEVYAQYDKKLLELSQDANAFRASEDRAFLQGMNIQMAERLFYGEKQDDANFVGFGPRYNTLDKTKARTAENVISAGSTKANANTSMWLICWGDQTAHGIYPKGSKAGWQHEALPQTTLFDPDGKPYEGYRTHYSWDMGLTVRDWRYIVRVCNIDLSDTASTADEALLGHLIEAVEKLPDLKTGEPIFYCNKELRTRLRNILRKAPNVQLSLDQAAGKHVMKFDEVPVKRCDVLKNTEPLVK